VLSVHGVCDEGSKVIISGKHAVELRDQLQELFDLSKSTISWNDIGPLFLDILTPIELPKKKGK